MIDFSLPHHDWQQRIDPLLRNVNLEKIENSKTVISYYQGAYGPTIRIDVKTKEWLEYFKGCVFSIIEGAEESIKLECLDDVEPIDAISLSLVKVHIKKHPKVLMADTNGKIHCFTWFLDKDALIDLVGLIDGLLDCDQPGHQYLTNDDDIVLIILAYKE